MNNIVEWYHIITIDNTSCYVITHCRERLQETPFNILEKGAGFLLETMFFSDSIHFFPQHIQWLFLAMQWLSCFMFFKAL